MSSMFQLECRRAGLYEPAGAGGEKDINVF